MAAVLDIFNNMKVFWSWQSDTPGETGRHLVRGALSDAIDELKQPPEIDEPTAKETRDALHLDHDIQGETGSPDLARTIFRKIDEAEIVIADVTLVGFAQTPAEAAASGEQKPKKKLINSNVAIELGYAFRAVTDKHVFCVFNRHYGTHEELPFDLRHKGGAIVYDLPPEADNTQIAAEREQLKSQFVERLRPYIQKNTKQSKPFSATPQTFSPAAYFQNKSEVLGEVGQSHDRVLYAYDTQKLSYIRLIPVDSLKEPLSVSTLRKLASQAPVLSRGYGGIVALNRFGVIRIDPAEHPSKGRAKIRSSTQLFQNGELWSISSDLIVRERAEGHPDGLPYPYLPSLMFEQVFYDTLYNLLKFARSLIGISESWEVQLGTCELTGVSIAIERKSFERFWGPIQITEIAQRQVISGQAESTLDTVLLSFFSRVYDAAGHKRPERLFGFPPERPGNGST